MNQCICLLSIGVTFEHLHRLDTALEGKNVTKTDTIFQRAPIVADVIPHKAIST